MVISSTTAETGPLAIESPFFGFWQDPFTKSHWKTVCLSQKIVCCLLALLWIVPSRGGHFRTTLRTSAPRTGAEPQFRCRIDGTKPAEKKVRNGGCRTTKNNFRTSAPTENYIHLNGNIVPFPT